MDFLAIRKQSRTARSGPFGQATTAERYKAIHEDAVYSMRLQVLHEQVGLSVVERSDNGFAPVHPKGSVSRLGYIEAYYISAVNESQARDAKEVLEGDYFIGPNAALTLPASVERKIRGSRPGGPFWPEESGVACARSGGVTGDDINVLVLDTGCDADHTQFEGSKLEFIYVSPLQTNRPRNVRGFDPDGHGTHVCGVIAGRSVGVAPNVNLYVASVIESESVTTSLRRILFALDWMLGEVVKATDPRPTILNLSLGFRESDLQEGERKFLSLALQSILQTLLDDFEVLTIVAAGNDGENNLRIPGSLPGVLAVGAVEQSGEVAPFTSRGSALDGKRKFPVPQIWGYGVDVYSSLERDRNNRSRYALMSGTSMAAPYVTGIAALYAQQSGARGEALRQLLLDSVDSRGIARLKD